ncbi:MAG: hypothetical protein ACYDCK_09120 [Thermoplasmatota archaeon]
MSIVPALALVALALAPAAPAAPATLTASVLGITQIAGSTGASEPSIAVAPNGDIYATGPMGTPGTSPMWTSHDGGTTFEPVILGLTGEGGYLGGGDADITADSAGRVFHVDLYLGDDSIAASGDNGNTWVGSPYSHAVPVDDRQWIVHYKDQWNAMFYDQIPSGIVYGKAPTGSTPVALETGMEFAEQGLVASDVTQRGCVCPPGYPAVDQNDGRMYIPYLVSGGLRVSSSGPDALTPPLWSSANIPASSAKGDASFPVAAVDAGGNVYVVYDIPVSGVWDIEMSVSTDHGAHFSNPVIVNSFTGTQVFPWIVAGASGHVAVAWYGTTTQGEPGAINAPWSVYYATSTNAASATPAFSGSQAVSGVIHQGSIDNNGLGGTGDRSLGDFFGMTLDAQGNPNIAFQQNANGFTGIVWTKVGPSLT